MTDVNSNEPVELTTKNGHKAKIRPFVSPRMSNEARAVFLRHAKMNPKVLKGEASGTPDDVQFADGIPAEIINEINDITLKRMVLEIDGRTGDEAYNYILDDIKQEDYLEIITKCNEISKATTATEEKKSS